MHSLCQFQQTYIACKRVKEGLVLIEIEVLVQFMVPSNFILLL